MTEDWTDVPVGGGRMAGFLVGEGPGVVMLQEIFGVNGTMQDKARRFARLGYSVLVPDLFWRLQPRVSLGYTDEDRTQGFDYFNRFDFAAGVADVAAAAQWLEERLEKRVAVIGFCLGGKLAVAATAAYPFAAVASLYGVKLETDPERLKAIDAPLQIHVGDRDTHVPMPAVEKIRASLAGRPNAQVFVYPGARHGFFNAARAEVFAPAAARQAQERIAAMFAQALQGESPAAVRSTGDGGALGDG